MSEESTKIESGRHKARAVDAQLITAQNGNKNVAITFELIEAPHAGRQLTYYGSFSEAAAEHTAKALIVAGFEGDDVSQLQTVRGEVALQIEIETAPDGRERPRIKFVNSLTPTFKSKVPPNEAKRFAGEVRGLFHRVRAKTGPSASGGSAEGLHADDAPF
jgi:hypothetical protein